MYEFSNYYSSMSSFHPILHNFSLLPLGSHFLNEIVDISDAESCAEQDGTNRFNHGDVMHGFLQGYKQKRISLSLPEDGCFY